ncbi:hypothetical protein [Flavobacterium sp.]|uniref:hypothetical protein n=1 Tax=Flavobacterium sp. TaxID=239 RepID=UPI0039E51EBF
MAVNKMLYQSIANSTAHRPIRDYNAGLIFENPELLKDLIAVALDVSDKHHHKACWILELVLERHIGWLSPHLDDFCAKLPLLKHDGAMRSMAKICQFAAERHLERRDFLNESHLKSIAETCFDWLIGQAKVATKAYAMRALYQIGKLQDWVYPELQSILEMGYPDHSAAYKAASKDILRRIR